MNYRLPASERLKSLNEIDDLFEKGSRLNLGLIRAVFLTRTSWENNYSQTNPKVLFTVPKKLFKRAVKRNLLKRRMKEAYRSHKYLLPENANIALAFVYVSDTEKEYPEVEKCIISALKKINSKIVLRHNS